MGCLINLESGESLLENYDNLQKSMRHNLVEFVTDLLQDLDEADCKELQTILGSPEPRRGKRFVFMQNHIAESKGSCFRRRLV
jgi:hypothetical protein